ncbi:RNA polymerase II transcription elongation factor SpEAF [Paecilomyces lecythidis]
MLRDELLRSKNDEIARCLLSRKRKLSELYFATVGFTGATGAAPADALYQQKEQAFLDANDLSKGRYFSEQTLPPFPDYATVATRSEQEDSEQATTNPTVPTGLISQDAVEPAVSPAVNSGLSDTAETRQHAIEGADQTIEGQDRIVAGDKQLLGVAIPGTASTVSQNREEKPSTGSQPVSSAAPGLLNAAVPETPSSTDDQGATATVVSPTGPQLAPGKGAVSKAPVVPISQRKHDKRPSLALGPGSHLPEHPLSPASSVGPYSNNTSHQTALSPDTSPGEEAAETVAATVKSSKGVALPSPKPDTSSQPPPTLVPSTPDEQLKLEEAQSLLQQKTVAPDSAIGDNSGTGDHPSSNEVIQESVVSLPIADAVSREPQVAPEETTISPLSSEHRKADAVSATPMETADSGQQPSEGTSTVSPTEKPTQVVSTPLSTKKSQLGTSTTPQLERMTTRVSSGAIRHKSVSEILGETPKTQSSQADSTRSTSAIDSLSPVSDKDAPGSAARSRLKDRKAREKERSKLSTVVFPKQQTEKNDAMDLVRQSAGDLIASFNEEKDYLFTLFQNKAYSPPRSISLSTLLASAHKTLSTSNHVLDYQEQMDCRTLRRIYSLQNANRWPLRQLKRSLEPTRAATHWDILLDHMKWMRTDFREERKWKIAAAKSCADWCAEYVNSDPAHKAVLRIRAKVPPRTAKEAGIETQSVEAAPKEEPIDSSVLSHPTPELIPSTEDDSLSEGFNDEPRHDLHDTVAPAAIFSLGSDEFTFSMDMTPAAEKILDELPIYSPVAVAPDTKLPMFKAPPDAVWKTDITPVSKYAMGKIEFRNDEPVRKRSRYDYSQYAHGIDNEVVDIPPEQTNVALFRPENKHIRDRIHPGYSFRPPTEHPMPSLGFFESRQSSQWTYSEDDELRRLVKEYSYNWSLISSCLTPPSLYTSGAERRTPWECFERWIGLEGLPAEMSKTQYFRAYQQRLETAQRTVLAQQQAAQQQQQQQQQGNNSQPQAPVRRRTTQPVRVDRRRASKHLALLDAMRKLAKKRETMLQKQQHATHLASLRKANEANQPKPPISSPADFSKLKYEREMKLQERQEQYRQQMIAQQRANLAAQRAGQLPNQQPMMNGAAGRTPNAVPPNGASPSLPGSVPNGMSNGVPPGVGVNQARPHPIQGIPNGAPINGPMPPNAMTMKMMPQGGMQQQMAARPGIPMQASPDNARVIREANRLQEQQRILQSRQQQQQLHNQQQYGQQGSHAPNVNMTNLNGSPNNPAMLAALQATGGMQSPPFHNGTGQGVSTVSPRMGQPNPLSSGVVPTISSIQSQIQRSNPNMPADQVNKLATDRLHQYQQQRMSQVAMNAAAGNMGAVQSNFQVPHDGNFQGTSQPGIPNGTPGMQNAQTQGYSPMMRVPQNAQQNRVGVGSSPALNGAAPQQSRSATPQTQRSGSVQAGPVPGSSKSPRPPQAQMANS